MQQSSTFTANQAPVSGPAVRWLHWICFGGFLLAIGWAGLNSLPAGPSSSKAAWPTTILLIVATLTTLISLSRRLPTQNVVLAAVIIASVAAIAQAIRAGVLPSPFVDRGFGPITNLGPLLWAAPLLWIVAILNSRGVAALILRNRGLRAYGYWQLALTTLLALAFVIGFELFVSAASGWRRHDRYLIHLAHLAITAFLVSIFITPAVINKKPVVFSPDYHPLAVWGLLYLLFVLVSLVNG